jgi:hypothetical protein
MFVGLFMFLYIMFNYGFHNTDSGAFTMLDAQRNNMMNPSYSAWAQDLLNFNHNWWGTGFCVCIVLVIICGFIDILRKPQDSLE